MNSSGLTKDLRICDDYLQFQNHLKDLRKLDDLIINTLNTTVLTATFRSQGSDAAKQCQQLGDQIASRTNYRSELISSCLSHTNDLMAQNETNDNRRKALIFQRRQLQNERNVEEIVRTNTEKILRSIVTTSVHTRAHQSPYVGTKDVQRTAVPDSKVSWKVNWLDYKATEYTASKVLKNPSWADDPDAKKIKGFNEFDGKIDRRSFMGEYEVDDKTNRPRNPAGRTGLSGRGLLGHWGPNHAADPVVTRWAKDQPNSKGKVLEIVLINRKDNNHLALPGGMIDEGENAFVAAKREFLEEAMNSNDDAVVEQIDKLFENADSIYKDYVDDPRNTDNAWMESEAIDAHDETGELTKDLKLEAGDDAAKVKWVQLDRVHNLYASHESMIRIAVKKHGAYEYWHDNQHSSETTDVNDNK
ncbi:unnamed protein product [Adineta steineri]|uniref:Nudix hydrolase domain-containing protein n=2 Tax=Adineta steineri TaxID=433720 RepID=A0A818PFL8_9BILA|nr:unnamed protein product [Adineta steineri]CAF3624132.1 unnamed protein product [Adineta steineri]